MLELARDLLPLLRAGVRVAVVTVTRVERSAPRGIGASMAVTADGAVIGSISGGCVESDAIALAHSAMSTGTGRTASFGFSDEAAHAAGLACGGRVDVIAYAIDPRDRLVMRALTDAAADRPTLIALRTSGSRSGTLVDVADLQRGTDAAHAADLADAIAHRDPFMLRGAYDDDVLVLPHVTRPRLIVLGAGEHAAALCRVGSAAGFAVTVCDAWETLVTRERFPDAAELVVALPHEYLAGIPHHALDARTAVCVLTHDERLDVPALATALSMPVGFVGAMGARRTADHRASLLRARGVDDVDLARLHSPLGLDLGASEPLGTALAVLAEIVASRHGGSGMPLRDLHGPIHRHTSAPGVGTAPAASGTGTAASGTAACGTEAPAAACGHPIESTSP